MNDNQDQKKLEIPEVPFALQVIGQIRAKEGTRRGVVGTIPCPMCGASFGYSIAKSNGHIHGRCEGCKLAFMM